MKKTADILIRIILVVSILGSIFFYYYGKFITSKKVLVKSKIIKLPPYPNRKKTEKKEIKKTKIIKKNIIVENYPILSNIEQLKKFLKENNIDFEFNSEKKEAIFKRVFVGPFNDKLKLIKVESKLKDIGLQPLRVKLRGAFFLHCGSYYYKEKAEELKKNLMKAGIKDIIIFEFKKPIDVYNLKIKNLDNSTFVKIKNFMEKIKIKYSVEE